jgi:hypothetical protein
MQDAARSCHPFNLPRLMDDLQRVYTGAGLHSSPSPDRVAREVLVLHLIRLSSEEDAWTQLLACTSKAAPAPPSSTPPPTRATPLGSDGEGVVLNAASPEALLTLQRLFVTLLPPPALVTSPLLFGCEGAQPTLCASGFTLGGGG